MHVNVNARLFFDVEGTRVVPGGPSMREKPTLLLLHGGPGYDHSGFKPAFSQLSNVAQVIYLDHRGNGRSDHGDPEHWTLNQWADDVFAFCEALGIERPIVLGESFGGMVAMTYAIRYPEHPRKLILCSTSAHLNSERRMAVFERLGGPAAREACRRFDEDPGKETFPDFMRLCLPLYRRSPLDLDEVRRAKLNLDVMWTWGPRGLFTYDLTPELHSISCPTLILGGEDDPVTPMEDQEEIAAMLRPELVRFERFPGARHSILRDDPERAFALTREFVLD